MAKHKKEVDYNVTPFDEDASPQTKADEFDQQYQQNRTYTHSPALDAYEKEQHNG